MPLTRRSLLIAGALVSAGCSAASSGHTPRAATTTDASGLARAHDLEQALITAYDAKIADATGSERARLEVERAIHVAHLGALRDRIPSATASPAASGHTPIAPLLRHSIRSLRSLALVATSGADAALFASIAASHETSLR
ncbi:MAG TPA: hypothetical protein VMH41_06590 [Mycobacteriales bacterium]|nr:hypothetical protein [Mycobacteriales bacterium]